MHPSLTSPEILHSPAALLRPKRRCPFFTHFLPPWGPRPSIFPVILTDQPGSTSLTRCGGGRKYHPGQHDLQKPRQRTSRPCDPDRRLSGAGARWPLTNLARRERRAFCPARFFFFSSREDEKKKNPKSRCGKGRRKASWECDAIRARSRA